MSTDATLPVSPSDDPFATLDPFDRLDCPSSTTTGATTTTWPTPSARRARWRSGSARWHRVQRDDLRRRAPRRLRRRRLPRAQRPTPTCSACSTPRRAGRRSASCTRRRRAARAAGAPPLRVHREPRGARPRREDRRGDQGRRRGERRRGAVAAVDDLVRADYVEQRSARDAVPLNPAAPPSWRTSRKSTRSSSRPPATRATAAARCPRGG